MNEIIDIFSSIFNSPVVIAGGAVRDDLLQIEPKDYDLFILKQSWTNWDDYKSKLSESLVQFPKVEAKVAWHKSEPFLIETIKFDSKEVQILSTSAQTMEGLIL